MCSKSKRFLFFLVSCLTYFAVNAQTLYWVGGNGNFNDPDHWSLSSGGQHGNITPSNNTNLVFDNESGSGYNSTTINIAGVNYANSVNFNNDFLPIVFSGNSFSELHVSGAFELNNKIDFQANTKIFFNSGGSVFHNVRFGSSVYHGDLIFQNGNWNLKYINVGQSNSVSFNAGNYKLHNSNLKTGNFYANSGNVAFDIRQSVFDIKEVFEIGDNVSFASDKFYLRADVSDLQKYKVSSQVSFGNNYRVINSGSITSVCDATLSSVGISCSGVCDGQLILSIDPACSTGPYTLSWANPSCALPSLTTVATPGTYTITGLCSCADFYSVNIFDGLGNLLAISNSTNIAGQSAINFVPLSSVLPSCFGSCNGSINGSLSGSVNPYTVTINGSASYTTNTGAHTYTGLCAGVNTFVVTDTKGCTKTFTASLGSPAALIATPVVGNLKCNAACIGSIGISPTGGTSGYTVNFNPGGSFPVAAGGTASLTSLCAGPVSITVTDTKGCTLTPVVNITQPPALTITASQTSVTCNGGNNGSATVNISGGVLNYQYTVTPAIGTFTVGTSSNGTVTLSGLSAGVHTITVIDQNACTITQTFNVTQPPALIVTPSFTTVSCFGGCNGKITLLASGGNGGPYSYTLTPPSGPATTTSSAGAVNFTGLCAGNYTAVTNDGSCTSTLVIVGLIAPSPMTLTPVSQNASCFGLCDGSATVTATGGNSASYSYTWSPAPPAGQGTSVISSLCAGTTYTVFVTDASLCPQAQATAAISGPASIIPNIVTANATCNGLCNGSITAAPSGTAAYNYTLVSTSGSTVAPPPYTGLCAGSYSLVIKNVVSACSQTFPVNVTQPNPIVGSVTTTSVTCFNQCNATLTGTVLSGGTPTYALSWVTPSGTVTGASITNQCAGSYVLHITDANGCTNNTITATIAQPTAALLATISTTNVTCFGGSNGAVFANPTGGTPGYIVSWVGGPTANPYTGLGPATYTLNLTDANGCTNNTVTAVITAPASIALNTATNAISCIGFCDGSATVTATGGNSSSYSYTWSPAPPAGQGTSVISSLCAGSAYTVSVRDASLCPQVQATVAIGTPVAIVANIVTTNVTCNGLCNGSITAAPSGTASYNYTLVSTSGSTVAPPPYTGLCAGSYSILIKNVLSTCSQTFPVSVTQPSPIVGSVVTTSVTCFNQCNATLTGTVLSGGTPTYALSWVTPTGTVIGGSITNQCVGSYVLHITDANGCTNNTITATITQPTAALLATINTTNVTCFNSTNGALFANPTGGTPGYTVSWAGGPTANPYTGLSPATYTLNLVDANGCINNTITAAVTAPASITVNTATTAVSCFGGSNGSAVITATGGVGSFTYQLNSPLTVNTTGNFSGLPQGTYSGTATDANLCSQSFTFIISQPVTLIAAITGTQNSCNACTGAATVTPSGGTPGYTYAWTNSLSASVATSSVASSLCAGNYTVTVTDTKTCTATQTVNIASVVNITLVATGGGIQCFGACTGSVGVTATGGTPTYSYNWTPGGQITPTVTSLCAGAYNVVVTDTKGCSNSTVVTLTQPAVINAASSQTNATCAGSCNGVITTTVTGGTGAPQYTWTSAVLPVPLNTSSLSNVCAGVYTLQLADANSCTVAPSVFTITQNAPIVVTFTTVNTTACALNNGSICATASGGVGGFTYSWSPVAGASSCLTGLTAGSYTLLVKDAALCTQSVTSIITNPAGPVLSVITKSVDCFGGSTGAATVNATGTGPFSFTWTPAVTAVFNPSSTIGTGLSNGIYNVTAIDNFSCITIQSVSIVQSTSLTAAAIIGSISCNGGSTGSISTVPAGGSGTYTYSWLPSGLTGGSTGTVTNLSAGIYTLNLTDSKLCSSQFTFQVDQPSAALTLTAASANIKCKGLCTGSISVGASGGTGAISYSWTPVGTFPGSVGTTTAFTTLCANVYTVKATDANNCATPATVITISEPLLALTSTLGLVNATCSNSCNAVATQSVSGGTPAYSYTWSSGASTSSVLASLCAGDYTGTVTDGNGCTVQKTFTVVPPAAFTVSLTGSNPQCNAICSGSITTVVNGAQGSVSYSWSPAGSGQNPTALCASGYTLIATDNNLCQATGSLTLVNPPAVLANVSSTNASCFGDCNGKAASLPLNTTGAISYTWLPSGANTPSLSLLCSGNYTLQIQDALGCQAQQTFTLTNPPALVITPSVTASSCSLSNGAITASVSGGSPFPSGSPYSYSWSPVSGTGSVITGLAAGVYSLVVSDVNTCSSSITVPVSNSNGPTSAPIISSSVACSGQCTGAASVNIAGITGGTPTYNVTWLSPAPSTLNPLTGLCAGNYIAQISDANGCVLFSTVTIAQPPPVTLTPTFGLPSCNGICDGSISLNPSGGVGPSFSYTWSPAGPPSGPVLTGACAGIYTIQINDNGCLSTQNVTLPSQLNITASTSLIANQCFGDCNGTASVFNVAGGVAPYTFSWSDGQTGTTATNLCNGNYSVKVIDANGCFNTFSVSIISGSQITSTVSITSPSCGLCNGGSTVTASGGVAPISYSWTTGSTLTAVSNLCAGIYEVLIMDNIGCQQTETVIINNSNGITGERILIQDISCSGTCDGSATVTATGGTAPFTYNWVSPAVSNSVITNLCAGTYFMQMTDAQGCLRTASVVINPVITLSVSPFVTAPGCNQSNGSVNILIAGGTPSYAISWAPVSNNTATLSGIGQGSYTVTVTESSPNACSVSQQVNVSNATGPVISATQANINCFGTCTGSVSAVASGVGPFTYNWSVGGTAATVTNLCKGIVTLTVTDSGTGCATIKSFTITDNPPIFAGSPQIVQPSCNLCNGSATLNVFGGTLPYTYTWTTGAIGPVASNLCAGLYQVQIKDNLGCQQTENVIINNSNGITGQTFSIQPLPCSGTCNGAATVTAIGGNPPIAYNWMSPAASGSSVVTNLCAGSYFVQMTDAQGCLRTSSISIEPVTTLSISTAVIQPGCNLTNGSIIITVSGGTPTYNISWAPLVSSSPTLSGIGQGSYTVTVTESSPNACSTTQQINVSNSTGPLVTAVQSDINCAGACTGSVSASVTGTGPFTYNWSTGGNTATVTDLCMGIITLSVTDVNSCVTIKSFTITQNPALQITAPAVTQPSCNMCNGAASVNALGGTLPYTYTWTTGVSSPSISSLCAGVYQVQITDNVGCQQTETVIINNSNGITGQTFSVQGLPCSGTCNGAATVTAVGGNAPYVYNWVSPAATSSVISNLCAGTYFVQMTDVQGCIRTASVDVDAVTTISLATTIVQPGCSLNNGSIAVAISGGTPTYNVSWAPVASSSPTLSGIGQGSYTITVTESSPNACSVTQQINLSNATGPIVSALQSDIDCFGTCTGSITVLTSGTGPFTYNWSVGGNATTVTNLCKGVVTLTVTDGNNCVTIKSFTITENPAIQAGVPQITHPSCNMCNGVASINALGGALPYTFVWTNGATGPVASGLCAGLYQVQITDLLGCKQMQNVIINNSTGITGQAFNVQDELCASSCNGAATVTAVGGASPISYSWINPAVPGPAVSNLCAGTYFVQMIDANGCILTASTTVNAATDFTITPSVKQPSCNTTNGSISVAVTGGTGSYTYSWLPAGSTSSITNIGPGTYTLTVTDGSGCSKTQVFNLSNSAAPAITFTQSNISCFNACTGSISIVATGSLAPFNYNWSVGGITTPDISNLCKGVVTLTVTGADGCISIRSFTLTDSPKLDVSTPHIIKPGCANGCDGSITLIPIGGSLPYASFSWLPSGSGNPLTSLCAGNYTAIVTDAKGCTNTSTIALNNPAPISVTATPNNSSCGSVADGSIGIAVSGGQPAYTYTWSGPGAYTSHAQNINNLLSGTYSLTLKDNAGCTRDTTLKLVTTISITARAGNDTTVCSETPVVLTGTNSSGAVSYSWFLLPNNTATVANTVSFATPGAAQSSTYVLLTVSSVPGCFDRDTVVVNAFPEIIVDAGPDVLVPVFSTVTIGGNPTAQGAIVSLTWTPAIYLNDPFVANPAASNTVNVSYTVTGSDINGCLVSDSVNVILYPEVKIPTGFSPNGDGKNDTWIIDYIDQFPNATVEVYNRWGAQLFYSKGYAEPFTGNYHGQGLPVGTYYYIVNLNHPAYTKPYTGPLTIFR